MHTGAHRVTIKTSSRNSRFGTRIQGIGTNYTHHCLLQPSPSQTQATQLDCHLSYTKFFFFSVYSPRNVSPWKGRSEGDVGAK